jgi:hypothetical protein
MRRNGPAYHSSLLGGFLQTPDELVGGTAADVESAAKQKPKDRQLIRCMLTGFGKL